MLPSPRGLQLSNAHDSKPLLEKKEKYRIKYYCGLQ